MKHRQKKRILTFLLTTAIILGMIAVPESPWSMVTEVEANTASLCTSQCREVGWHGHWNSAGTAFWYYRRGTASLTGWQTLPENNTSLHEYRFHFRTATGPQTHPPSTGPIGSMVTGWIWDGSHWFFLNNAHGTTNAGKMATGWLHDAGQTYFLRQLNNQSGTGTGPRGSMLLGTTRTVDGQSRTFNNSGHCSFETRPRVFDARIRFDQTYFFAERANAHETAMTDFRLATSAFGGPRMFDAGFNVVFSLRGDVLRSSDLNGSETCSRLNSQHCNIANFPMDGNQNCGTLANCNRPLSNTIANTGHHKSASRLMDALSANNTYTVSMVNHALCRWDTKTSTHLPIRGSGIVLAGVGTVPGRDSIIVHSSTTPNRVIIQHELSHNFGAHHDSCMWYSIGARCVIGGGAAHFGEWCPVCARIMRANT
jgi:hypothetical protein